MIWITLGIIIIAIGGLLLTRYITKNKFSEHMVCPMGQDCHAVVNGRFSRFFGVSVDKMGSVYYGIIALVYLLSIIRDVPESILLAGLLLAGIGFAFSMYLTIIQIFVIKQWCTLCLGSGALSFLIVVLAFLGFESSFVEFAYTHRDLLKWLYALGVVVGTCITTLHARIFINFLNDFKISPREVQRLEMFSHTAWVSIGLSFLTGLGLVLTDRWHEYIDSNSFIVMAVILGMLIVYEVIVNMILSPRLVSIHFGNEEIPEEHEYHMYRKIAFSMLGVGVVSWYSLLLLSAFNWFNYSSGELFIGYIVLVILAVIITLWVESIIQKKAKRINGTESITDIEA
ncbi:hypothetical protein KC901_01285 [Patescibacteria group bacterium]|nr:hypothetical protein [Patescibacteria group bacterium]